MDLKDLSLKEGCKEFIKKCIRRKNFAWHEDFFLEVIANPRNKMEVYWSVLALRGFGSERSIPILKELIYFPMQDVKACSILTIAQLAGAKETAFYASALLDPKYREKDYALWAIWAVANDQAIKAVNAYLKKCLPRVKSNRLGTPALAVEYLLEQPVMSTETAKLLVKLVESKEPASTAEQQLFDKIKACLK